MRVIPNRQFHMAAHDWGSIQSWESATEPKFKGRLLSLYNNFRSMFGSCGTFLKREV